MTRSKPPRRMMAAMTMLLLAGFASARASDGEQDRSGPHRVFFDWGKATVGHDGAAMLDDVASLLLQRNAGPASIVGHSDRSGPADANRRSALQRAAAVREYLVRRGVPATQLQVASRGEDAPFIATSDGVREPQNRRVDIVIAGPATADRDPSR